MNIYELNASFATQIGTLSGLLLIFTLTALFQLVLMRPKEKHEQIAQWFGVVTTTLSSGSWLASAFMALWTWTRYTVIQVESLEVPEVPEFLVLFRVWPIVFLVGLLSLATTIGVAGFFMSRKAGVFTALSALIMSLVIMVIWAIVRV